MKFLYTFFKKKPLKKIVLTLLVLVLGFCLWQWELVAYGLMQGKGQVKVLWEARPLTEFLEDDNFPDSLKAKIRLIQKIRSFSETELGLLPSESYTTLYDQQGEPILWNVTAAEPYALEAKEWTFPFLGTFSYKGFFDKKKALATQKDLQEKGWDTELYPVSAWSTLGWFNDPILSENLKRSEGRLAALIIHELTHGTLFIKDKLSFNENLANFVGDKGAILFLKHHFGENSPQLADYLNGKKDRDTFKNYVLKASKGLDSLYQGMDKHLSIAEMDAQKEEYIMDFVAGMQDLHFENKRYYRFFRKELPNNTFFMGYLRYDGKRNFFEKEFEEKFDSNFPKYLTYLKEKYKK